MGLMFVQFKNNKEKDMKQPSKIERFLSMSINAKGVVSSSSCRYLSEAKHVLILLVIAAFFSSCEKSTLVDSSQNVDQADAISLSTNLSVANMDAGTPEAAMQSFDLTKSAIGTDEPSTTIQNLWILQFDKDGTIVGTPTYIEEYQTALEYNENVAIMITSGEDMHTIVYVANTFNNALTSSLGVGYTIDQFKALTYDISDEKSNFNTNDDKTYYAVLYGEIEQSVNSTDGLDKCTLVRNVAKINITIDVASGVDLTFSEAVVKGVPSISSYFPNILEDENFPADNSFNYINYDSEEISEGTTTLTFYVPVNMRGTSSSSSEMLKNHYATPYCTSISLLSDKTDDGKVYLYSFYLGENLIDDYNIKPNTEYSYTFTFNTVGDPDTDLRIEEISSVDFSLPTISRSNCYILNPVGVADVEYTIPIDRIDEFWGDTRYNSGNITGNTLSDIGDNWEAVILWHDHTGDQTYDNVNDQIGGFKLVEDYDNQTVKVTLPKEFNEAENHCNVVFVVRKKDGDKDILWSWHLWITDYDPYPSNLAISTNLYQYTVTGGELHRYDNTYFSTGIYSDKLIMDRNIGARSATAEGYGLDSDGSYTGAGILHYQYGRNVPIPYNKTDCYKDDYQYTQYPSSTTAQVTMAEAVQMPYAHIKYSGNWCSDDDGNTIACFWNDYKVYMLGKSIFDPSPWGFCLPLTGVWTGFTGNSAANEYNSPDSYAFKLVNNNEGVLSSPYDRIYNNFALYPATGMHIQNSGSVSNAGIVGYYWTASPCTTTNGYILYFTNTGSVVVSYLNRAYGISARSIQE